MFRKIIAAAVGVLLCCALAPAARARGADAVEIATAQDLVAIAGDPAGHYVLTDDIDMAGVDWAPLPFTGTLDGAGHGIYNLSVTRTGADRATTVDGNQKRYDTVFAGLFSVVRDATIRDLTLRNVMVRITTDENCFAAGLAGFAEDTVITGCSVQGRIYLYQTNRMAGVAGVVGFGHGTIAGCAADVELVFVDGNRDINCEQFLGAIQATGYSDVENCTVNLMGYASVHGYVHNGGITGMYYVYNRAERTRPGYVRGCTVDAAITFFENNRDRRAYCKATVGEVLNRYVKVSKNTVAFFERIEILQYDKDLLPEVCEDPAYTAAVTPPTCTQYGYTTYTCDGCGYSYTDDYVRPAHTPGPWETVVEPTYTQEGLARRYCAVCGELLEEKALPVHVAGEWTVAQAPTYDAPGLRRRLCTVCGEVLEEEQIPRLICVSSCALDSAQLEMTYKSTARLTADIQPADASDTGLTWSSSDENVAMVDDSGVVTAAGRGAAVITCASADGYASSACAVTVGYTFWQWLIVIILFGWIWY